MKLTLITALLLMTQSILASSRPTIDDLESIRLRVKEKSQSVDIHYPNYRIGGGTPPTRQFQDCLIMDVLDSDNRITPELKLQLAGEIRLEEGFGFSNSVKRELLPEIKGNNIVFKMPAGNVYVTSLTVSPRNVETLNMAISQFMPATHGGNYPAAVNLLYVRGCRL